MKKKIKNFYWILVIFCILSVEDISQKLYGFYEYDYDKEFEKYKDEEKEKYLSPIELKSNILKKQKQALNQLKMHLEELKKIATFFYSPIYSYFNKKVASYESPNFDIKVYSKGIDDGRKSIRIKKLAEKDKISTGNFSKDKKFNGGNLIIQTSNKKFEFYFSKDSKLEDIYKELFKKQDKKYYKVQYINIDGTGNNNRLIIASVKTGVKNKINLSGDKKFLKELGFVILSQPSEKDKNKKDDKKKLDLNKPLKEIEVKKYSLVKGKVDISQKKLKIFPNAKVESQNLGEVNPEHIDYIELFVKRENERVVKKEKEDNKQFKDDEIGSIEKFTIGDIDFETGFLKKYLKYPILNDTKKEENENKDENSLWINFFDQQDVAIFNKSIRVIKIDEDNRLESDKWRKIRINVNHLDFKNKKVKKLYFLNKEDRYSYLIREVKILYNRIRDKAKKKSADEKKNKLLSYNYITKAEDANFAIDGVEYFRPENSISDVLPGSLLEIYSTNKKEEFFKVEKNIKGIVTLIFKLVQQYNNVMIFLANITNRAMGDNDDDKEFFLSRITLKDYKKREEKFKKKSREDREYEKFIGTAYRGYLQYEFFLESLKSKLHKIISYPSYNIFNTKEKEGTNNRMFKEQKIKFLSQIGVKSISSNTFSKGFHLEIDEDKLYTSLKRSFKEIEKLFGTKKDENSKVKDAGVAVNLVQIINFYVKSTIQVKSNDVIQSGIIKSKIKSIESALRGLQNKYELSNQRVKKRIRKFSYDLKKIDIMKKEFKKKEDFLMNNLKGLEKK